MVDGRSGGSLIILGTFILSLFLSQIPLPEFLRWMRPEWVPMFLVFWIIWSPNRVGLLYAFMLGLFLDLARGSVIGLNALSLTLIAFVSQLLYRRLRMFPLPQQGIVLMLLVGLNQLLYYWMQGLTGTHGDSLLFLLPSVISGILWPVIFVMLRWVARTFHLGRNE